MHSEGIQMPVSISPSRPLRYETSKLHIANLVLYMHLLMPQICESSQAVCIHLLLNNLSLYGIQGFQVKQNIYMDVDSLLFHKEHFLNLTLQPKIYCVFSQFIIVKDAGQPNPSLCVGGDHHFTSMTIMSFSDYSTICKKTIHLYILVSLVQIACIQQQDNFAQNYIYSFILSKIWPW